MLSVTEHDRTNIANAQTVNQNSACRYLACYSQVGAVSFDNIAYGADDDIALGDTDGICKACALFQVLVLAVNGNEK